MEALRATGALLFFPKGALTHHPEGAVVLAVGKPCALRGGLRLLRQPPDNATAPMGAAVGAEILYPMLPPACANLPPAALPQRWTGVLPAHFLFAKEKQKKETR